ncbi:DUF2160 family membrane protein [Ferrovibrio sp.]|uniref:DUF2160 domain-containing protein n=1 Tax=Ferrovibrio sp. TaxID=1917215 RepID=UPI002625E074|nr:DUF2160 family membrane protein [Ferrovibrio sp.]
MDHIAWMAWTWQTGIFFAVLVAGLTAMTLLALRRPEPEKRGALGILTRRGDRLFISLLGGAFLHLLWLGLFGADLLLIASALSLFVATAIFRWV